MKNDIKSAEESTLNNDLFEMAHTRAEYPNQRARMEECARLGICPFCWENLHIYHDAPILKRGRFWIITANDHPYAGAPFHYLAIYKYHQRSIGGLSPEAGDELFQLFSELCEERDVKGAAIFIRFGDMKYNGATVYHLHAQILSGVSREEISEPDKMENWIMAKIGYKAP